MKIQDKHNSTLTMKSLYIKNFSFTREKIIDNSELEMSLIPNIKIINEDEAEFEISLMLYNNQKQFDLSISIFAAMQKKKGELDWGILKSNVFAIIFPFLRSQVSILTSQPDFKPILMPVVNINKIFEDIDSENIIE